MECVHKESGRKWVLLRFVVKTFDEYDMCNLIRTKPLKNGDFKQRARPRDSMNQYIVGLAGQAVERSPADLQPIRD